MAITKSFAKRSQVRPGSKTKKVRVVTNYGGGDVRYDEIEMREVEHRGEVYDVPVDSEGFVPEDVLYAHFLDTNNWTRGTKERNASADARTRADRVHKPKDPRGFTPEEIVQCGWWPYVNESDVEGIDDAESRYLGPDVRWEDVRSGAKVPFAKIAIMMPEKERDRAIKTIQDNFTNSELKRMTNQSGLIITEGVMKKGVDGYYRGRQIGQDCPKIVLGRGWSEDTLTHEMVHCARQCDENRTGMAAYAFPMDDERVRMPTGDADYRNRSNLEEACTVAEALTRTREPTTDYAGYYQYTDAYRQGKSVADQYAHDRGLMVPGKPFRGKRAVDRTYSMIDDTDIITMKEKGRYSASEMIARGRADGKFQPKGERPKTAPKKKAKKAKTEEGS